jgi:hypothetical protein
MYIVAWSPAARRWEVYQKGAEPRFPQRFSGKEDALARALQLATLANDPCVELRDEEGRTRTLGVADGVT